DPVPPVAAALAGNLRCLAFDEMVVNNSADAMILSRLFRALIVDEGVTVVTTSNRSPRDLYKDGLNREHFLPFIDLIEARLDVLELNGPVDYRLDRLGDMATWHTPLGDAATAQLREAFFRLTDYPPEDAAHVPSAQLDVGGGRTLHVPKSFKGVAVFSFQRLCGEPRGAADYLASWHPPLAAAATAAPREASFRRTDYPPEDAAHVPSAQLDVGGGRTLHVPKSFKGVAVFSFKRLCGEPRGAADYLAIAHAYHTVIVVGIPVMGPDLRNDAARIVYLIDALYDNKVKLLASAAAEPEQLYPAGDGQFEFARTVSRLREMQSAEYMALGHGEPG